MKNQKPYWLILPIILLIGVVVSLFKFPLYVAVWGIVKLDSIAECIISINNFIGVPFLISTIVFVILWIFRGLIVFEKDKDLDGSEKKQFQQITERAMTVFKLLLPWFIILKLVSALIPTTKEAAVIVVVPTVVNYAVSTEEINRIPKSFFNLADSWLNELTPDNVKASVKGATETVSNALGNVVGKTKPIINNTIDKVGKTIKESKPIIKDGTTTVNKIVDKIPN